jgi:glycosyltransferase involved in cell wall biosynthesis
MNIWFTEIGEPLPLEQDARLCRYGHLTQILSRLGHQVTWWTSTFSHAHKRFLVRRDCDCNVNGVTIKCLHGPGYQRNVSWARIRHQQLFARRFGEVARCVPRPDIIISPVPTIEAAEMAIRFGGCHKIPVLIDIRDEWPDEFVDLAPAPTRRLVKTMLAPWFKKMSFICRNALGIMGVAESNLTYGLRFAGRGRSERDGIFPIGYSAGSIDEVKIAEANQWWKTRGLREAALTICFFGTIGRFFNLDTPIEAIRQMEQDIDVQLVVCGDGSSFRRFQKKAAGSRSLLFPGWVSAPQIAALMRVSSAGLAPYAAGARMTMPNKPFEYLAGSLPVISSLSGELAGQLEERECGFTYHPDSVIELSRIIRQLAERPDQARRMGLNGRRLLEDEYTIEKIGERMSAYLTRIVRTHSAAVTRA